MLTYKKWFIFLSLFCLIFGLFAGGFPSPVKALEDGKSVFVNVLKLGTSQDPPKKTLGDLPELPKEDGVDGTLFELVDTKDPSRKYTFTLNQDVGKNNPDWLKISYLAPGRIKLSFTDEGTYTLEEKKPPEGYESQSHIFQNHPEIVKGKGEEPLEANKKIIAKISIPSYDEDGNLKDGEINFKAMKTLVDISIKKYFPTSDTIRPLNEGSPISDKNIGGTLDNVEFTLYKKEVTASRDAWNEVGKVVTEAGVAKMEGLYAGSYKLVETSVPQGFEISSAPRFFDVKSDDTSSDPKFQFEFMNYEMPIIKKYLNDIISNKSQDVSRGNTLKYNLKIDVPADISKYKHFVITDQADKGIIFLSDVATLQGTKAKDKSSVVCSNYCLAPPPPKSPILKSGGGGGGNGGGFDPPPPDISSLFTITRDSDNHLTITGNTEHPDWKRLQKTTLDIEVYARFAPATGNEGDTVAPRVEKSLIDVSPDNAYTNQFTLTYRNGYAGDGEGTPTNKELTSNTVNANPYELRINLNKVKSDGTTPLSGAKFTLTPKSGTAAKAEYLASNTREITIGASGAEKIEKLDAGTYELKETETPEGYRLLDTPKTIEIKEVDKRGLDNGDENNPVVAPLLEMGVTIKNFSVEEWLPNTGTSLVLPYFAIGMMSVLLWRLLQKKKERN